MEDEVELQPVWIELASGHVILIEHEILRDSLRRPRILGADEPGREAAIHILSTEGGNGRGLVFWDELRSGVTFDRKFEDRILAWARQLACSHEVLEYDGTNDFLSDFEEAIGRICSEGDDAAEHIAELPEHDSMPPIEEDDFDPEDDSNFNDQGDSKNP